MSDELKPCPFCMGKAREFIEATIPPGDKYAHCAGLHNPDVMCPNDAIMTVEQWNTRPVEDALRAELAAARAEAERMRDAIEYTLAQMDYMRRLWGGEGVTDGIAQRLKDARKEVPDEQA